MQHYVEWVVCCDVCIGYRRAAVLYCYVGWVWLRCDRQHVGIMCCDDAGSAAVAVSMARACVNVCARVCAYIR